VAGKLARFNEGRDTFVIEVKQDWDWKFFTPEAHQVLQSPKAT
jgi:hypothetical protein